MEFGDMREEKASRVTLLICHDRNSAQTATWGISSADTRMRSDHAKHVGKPVMYGSMGGEGVAIQHHEKNWLIFGLFRIVKKFNVW